jgi:protein-disulfide isomerase
MYRAIALLSIAASLACTGGDDQGTPRTVTPSPTLNTASDPDAAARDSVLSIADQSRMKGDPNAPVWMIVVSDFECPFCKLWHDETYPSIVSRYVDPGHVRIAYVHLPGDNHPHARSAAEASMCAGLQGRFWEYHDAIFASFAEWQPQPPGTGFFVDDLPGRAGVDPGALRQCIASGLMRPVVLADRQRSLAAGLNSTPNFVIDNTTVIRGAQPLATFERALDAALATRGISAR